MSKCTLIMVKNRGSALIIALVFLLVMTLIGVTAMQGTSQQETMAGNMRDRSLAFQAAEAALRVAERAINNPPIAGLVTAPKPPRTDNDWINIYDWSAATQLPVGTLSGITDQPSYVIEDTMNEDVACLSNPALGCYRITARGLGGSTNAIVILQSTFYRL